MSVPDLGFLLAGALAGGFINGLAGFGTALFALGWWLQIMPPVNAVAMVLAMSVLSGLQGAFVVRHAIRRADLARFVLPGLLGLPAGYAALQYVEARSLTLIVAGFLLLFGGFFTLRRRLPKLQHRPLAAELAIGCAGGVLGAMTGLSGALPTMWLALFDQSKAATRAILQPYNIIILSVSAVLLALDGAYDRQTLLRMVIALPATLLAAQIGIALFKRLEDAQFRRLLIAMMLISGLVLAGRAVFT